MLLLLMLLLLMMLLLMLLLSVLLYHTQLDGVEARLVGLASFLHCHLVFLIVLSVNSGDVLISQSILLLLGGVTHLQGDFS